jgi:replicative DNA helicase
MARRSSIAKYNDDFYTGSTIRIYQVLGAAMAKAKSTDPVKVAAAMEGSARSTASTARSRCARPTTS